MVVAAGVEPALAAFSALCLCRLGYATFVKLAPAAGLAPARTRLKDETLGSLHSRAFDEMAERGGHAPHHAKCATISLAKNPGSLVRFTFHGAHDRSCTCTVRGLKSAALLVGLRGHRCSQSDSHRH